MCVQLKGVYKTKKTQRSSKSRRCFLNKTVILSQDSSSGTYPFSIRIPSEVTLDGETAPTPPSISSADSSCEILYSLKFSLCKRRSRVIGIRSRESLVALSSFFLSFLGG